MEKPVILHFTPHLNGGLGRVLLSTLKFSKSPSALFAHEIVVTDEKHLTPESLDLYSEYSNLLHIGKGNAFIKAKMEQADILQIEWWNHPLIYQFLIGTPLPPSRVVLCCHVAGLTRPHIVTKSVVEFSDIFLAANKATGKHPLFGAGATGGFNEKLRFVTYPVDFERLGNIAPKAHGGFNVGYIGTLDYSKLHREFLDMSSAVDIPDVNFILCGSDHNGALEKEAQKHGADKFQFMGFMENVKDVFEILDVFGYPLNATHFGSGEQAIIEAMYAGLPVVAFSNPPEQEIISHNETGILVDSEKEYTEALYALYRDPAERARLGENAKNYIKEYLAPLRCFQELEKTYGDLMSLEKRSRIFNPANGNFDSFECDLGARLFIESLGLKGREFAQSYKSSGDGLNNDINDAIAKVEPEMAARTKGGIFQYLYFFPDDAFLNFWAGLICQGIGNREDAKKCFEAAVRINPKNKDFKFYLEHS